MAVTSAGPPIAGAYMCPVLTIDANATTSTAKHAELDLPAGMTAVLIGISAHADSVTSDPAITVGTAAAVTGILTAANLTTTAQRLTPNGSLTSSGRYTVSSGTPIRVAVTNDSGDACGAVNVGLHMYVTGHATNVQSD